VDLVIETDRLIGGYGKSVVAIGCAGGVLLGALACWDLARRRDGE
jgi:hypothetical protein